GHEAPGVAVAHRLLAAQAAGGKGVFPRALFPADDFYLQFLADVEVIPGILHEPVRNFRDVDQAPVALGSSDEHAVLGDAGNHHVDPVADVDGGRVTAGGGVQPVVIPVVVVGLLRRGFAGGVLVGAAAGLLFINIKRGT